MARPRSELTQFILSLPANLPVAEVVHRANHEGLKTTGSNVQRVRAMARRAPASGSKGRSPSKATKATAEKVGPTSPLNGRAAPVSKSDFIRSRPSTATAAEVIAAATAAGLTMTPQLVYKVRAERMAPRRVAATNEAAAPPSSGVGADLRAPPSGKRASPLASAERPAPFSTLPGVDDLIRSATEDEVRRETSAIDALRAALARYEAVLLGVARARVIARVAVALELPAPARDVPDVSVARAALVTAIDALSTHLRPVEASSPEHDKASSAASADEAPAPSQTNGQGAAALDREQPALQPVEAPPGDEVALAPELDDASVAPANLERAAGEPEPALVAADVAASAPLSKEEVRAFFQRLVVAPPAPAPRPTSAWARERDTLQALLGRAARMGDLSTDAGGLEELDALDEITADTASWTTLSRPVQHLWLSFLVARARRLKDWTVANVPTARKRMNEVIVRLPTFAHDARPGHVNGMRPNHVPIRASWEADAEALLSELRAVLSDEGATPAPVERRPKPPKKRVTERERSEPEPINWPLRERVGKMRIVLFGGEPREEARLNLQRTLGIGALEWPESGKPRRLDALANSVANGKHDVVLVLRGFVAHTESNRLIEAARQHGTPYAFVDSGYGTGAVREAIELALHGR